MVNFENNYTLLSPVGAIITYRTVGQFIDRANNFIFYHKVSQQINTLFVFRRISVSYCADFGGNNHVRK